MEIKAPLNINYVSTYDASDIHEWSGLGYYIAKSLEDQQAHLSYTRAYKKSNPFLKAKSIFYRMVTGKSFLADRTVISAKQYARSAEGNIPNNTDVIFSPGSIPIAYLDSTKPKAFYTDACFAGLLDFYEGFSNLCPEAIQLGHQIEQAALSSCALTIYSSDWAAKTAMENYSVDSQKVKVVPFGANIDCDRTYNDIVEIVSKRSKTTCKLLFLGIDFERKGGPMALEIAKKLNAIGLKTELHIVGPSVASLGTEVPFVINHGFISKATREGIDRMEHLFEDCHFLLLPTKAEAYGVVFCEASSFGVPSISTIIGGVPTIVKDNANGRLFSLSATAEDYTSYILNTFRNYDTYKDLALASFNEYSERLNWKAAGKSVMNLLKDI